MAKTTNNLSVSAFTQTSSSASGRRRQPKSVCREGSATARVVDLSSYRGPAVSPADPPQRDGCVISLLDRGAKHLATRRNLVRNTVLDVVMNDASPVASVTFFLHLDGSRDVMATGIEPEFAQILIPDLEQMTETLRRHAMRRAAVN